MLEIQPELWVTKLKTCPLSPHILEQVLWCADKIQLTKQNKTVTNPIHICKRSLETSTSPQIMYNHSKLYYCVVLNKAMLFQRVLLWFARCIDGYHLSNEAEYKVFRHGFLNFLYVWYFLNSITFLSWKRGIWDFISKVYH